ncbi:MAG: winged helix-turn-helix domain-containing protein, partial [Gammaproteobacteria bacterium]
MPEFDLIKAPALQIFADEKPRTIVELDNLLAEHFTLSDEARAEVLPSGTERRWHNRVSWACYDLYRAGLLERVKRGTYRITAEGRRVANEKPRIIDREYLMKYPQFAEWISVTSKSQPSPSKLQQSPEIAASSQTPEEIIEIAHATLQAKLTADVTEYLHKT